MAEMIPFGNPEGESKRPAPAAQREDPRNFSNEEVSEIIRVALRSREDSRTNTVGYDEMLTIAKDFGLTPGDITRAFDEINGKRDEQQVESRAKLSVKIHGIVFIIVMAGLFGINFLSDRNDWWAFYPLVGWGTVLALHGVLALYVPKLVAFLLGVADDATRELGESHLGAPGADRSARFTIPELYQGLAQATGLLQMQDDTLLLEFETKDSVFGALKSGVREVRVPFSEIASVRLERQFWNSRLILRGHRLKCFESVPGHEGGQIKLTLNKNSRAAGERIARELADRIAEA